MGFIRYKQFGNKEYAYEITAYWDPKLKKPRQKSKYLGVVIDKEKGEIYVISRFCKMAERVFPNLISNSLFRENLVFNAGGL